MVFPNYPSNPPPHPRRSRASFVRDIGIRISARSHNWACNELSAVAFNQWGTQGTTAAVARSEDAGAAPWSAKSLRECRIDKFKIADFTGSCVTCDCSTICCTICVRELSGSDERFGVSLRIVLVRGKFLKMDALDSSGVTVQATAFYQPCTTYRSYRSSGA